MMLTPMSASSRRRGGIPEPFDLGCTGAGGARPRPVAAAVATAWSRAKHRLGSNDVGNNLWHLDRLLRSVLTALEMPPLPADALPRGLASRPGSGQHHQHHHTRKPSNRVDGLLRQVRRLEDRLIALRRDFTIDEHYCSWADAQKGPGVASAAAVGASGRRDNVCLDLILSQYRRSGSASGGAAAAGEASRKDGSGGRRSEGGSHVVVPLKRAELFEKAFDETLQQVLKDTEDFTRCFTKVVALRNSKRQAAAQAAEAARLQANTADDDDDGNGVVTGKAPLPRAGRPAATTGVGHRSVPDQPETHRDFLPPRRMPRQRWLRRGRTTKQVKQRGRTGLIAARQGEFDALQRAILVDVLR